MTHTKGPWTYDRTTNRIGTTAGTICIIDEPADQSGRGIVHDQQTANARLIHKAPEMYEVLSMYQMLNTECHRGVTHCGECASCKGAALLAQIEGETDEDHS